MSLANKPINPISGHNGLMFSKEDRPLMKTLESGMTLLEHYAGLAMQGLLSNDQMNGPASGYAKEAVEYAKALIAELEREGV